MRSALDELDDLSRKSTQGVADILTLLAISTFRGDEAGRNGAMHRLATAIGQTMAFADLLGRRRLLLEIDSANEDPGPILFAETPLVPSVPFAEALRDLVRRHPRLADPFNGLPLWQQVVQIYQSDRIAFAIARAADLVLAGRGAEAIQLTATVRDTLASGFRRGAKRETTQAALEKLNGFTRAYAETVYRTNLTKAFAAGRMEQAKDDDIAVVIGGFQFQATLDSDVRPNHAAAHDLIASQFDPIWDRFSPPLGYNCRCGLRMVPRRELASQGLIRANEVIRSIPPGFGAAGPDPGFRPVRPDREVYTGSR